MTAEPRGKRSNLVTVTIGRDIMVVIDFRRGSIRVNVPEGVEVAVDPPARDTRIIGRAQQSVRVH